MKHKKKLLLTLIILLFIISLSIVTITGKTYTVSIKVDSNDISDYNIKIDKKNIVKIVDKNIIDNTLKIKFKSIHTGKVFISINDSNYFHLYVHKIGVITYNDFFGESHNSIVLPISILIVLIYILYLLIMSYKISISKNLYQYKNVVYLGMIVFFIFITINQIFSCINYSGLSNNIDNILISSSSYLKYTFPFVFTISILMIISNIILIKKEGKSLKNLLGLFSALFFCIMPFIPDIMYQLSFKLKLLEIHNLNSIYAYIYKFIEVFTYELIVYFECILIGNTILGIKVNKYIPKFNKDYMIILGCKTMQESLSPLLKSRADKAIEFRNLQKEKNNKDLIFIPSGGKGRDEVISEGEAISNYLIEQGISKKNILVENKSTNTYENIKYSYKLIKNKDSNIAFSTTNYHVFRAGLLATEIGLNLEGIGSRTKNYFMVNAFIREYIGSIYSEKKKHLIIILIIIFVTISMIIITYLSNNI